MFRVSRGLPRLCVVLYIPGAIVFLDGRCRELDGRLCLERRVDDVRDERGVSAPPLDPACSRILQPRATDGGSLQWFRRHRWPRFLGLPENVLPRPSMNHTGGPMFSQPVEHGEQVSSVEPYQETQRGHREESSQAGGGCQSRSIGEAGRSRGGERVGDCQQVVRCWYRSDGGHPGRARHGYGARPYFMWRGNK